MTEADYLVVPDELESDEYGGIDFDEARRLLEDTAILPYAPDLASQIDLVRTVGLTFRPDPGEVLATFGPEDGLAILESIELPDIQRRLGIIAYLNADVTPFRASEEMPQLIERFIDYLNRNKEHLMGQGHPQTSFEPCQFLEAQLGRLYYTKLPAALEAAETAVPANDDDEYLYDYTWMGKLGSDDIRDAAPTMQDDAHEEADPVEWLSQADATRLEGMRGAIFGLKLNILAILAQSLQADANDKWEECVEAVVDVIRPVGDLPRGGIIFAEQFFDNRRVWSTLRTITGD